MGITLAGSNLALDVVRLLLGIFGGFGLLSLLAQSLTVVSLPPLTEGSRVNLDDAALDESLGSDQLVVGSIVHDINDTALAGDCLRSPREISSIQTKSAELAVSTTGADRVNALLTDLGHGRLAAQFELALLAVVCALGTGVRTLVAAITANTYSIKSVHARIATESAYPSCFD